MSRNNSRQVQESPHPPKKPHLIKRIMSVCLKAQWIVGGSCTLAAICYPQVEVYGFLVGAFSNAFLSKGLKRLIRQDRPLHKTTQLAHDEGARTAATHLVEAATSAVVATAVDTAIFAADEIGIKHPSPTPILHALPVPMEKELGHGMPSSHAMSLCFFATYIALACQTIYLVSHPNGVSSIHPFISLLRNLLPSCLKSSWDYGYGRYIFMTIMFVLVILECASRVRRRYHTWAQIIVGSILGSIVGYIHSTYAMPILREVSRDIPPLAERSNTFIITFSLGMTLLGALTLERNTQRVAKRLIRSIWRRLRRTKVS